MLIAVAIAFLILAALLFMGRVNTQPDSLDWLHTMTGTVLWFVGALIFAHLFWPLSAALVSIYLLVMAFLSMDGDVMLGLSFLMFALSAYGVYLFLVQR